MTEIKLAVWNMEWLDKLFLSASNGGPGFKPDDIKPEASAGHTVGERKEMLAKGLAKLDADCVVVVEGPHSQEELEIFFDEVAEGEWTVFLQESRSPNGPATTQVSTSLQNVGVALRTDRGKFADEPLTIFDAMEPDGPDAELLAEASGPFWHDTGEDKIPEWYRFFRRPAYVEIRLENDARFRVLGLHLKSKGIFSAFEWSRWWAMAEANRERLLAECRQIREKFLDVYLQTDLTADVPLVVCGDINDGPGFDTSEMKLKASGIETLMGSVWKPNLTLNNALFESLSDRAQERLDFSDLFTTSFADPIFNSTYHRVWIDHILYTSNGPNGWVKNASVIRDEVEPGLPFWKISDHYPVVATVSL